jgi:hypothetical protein
MDEPTSHRYLEMGTEPRYPKVAFEVEREYKFNTRGQLEKIAGSDSGYDDFYFDGWRMGSGKGAATFTNHSIA